MHNGTILEVSIIVIFLLAKNDGLDLLLTAANICSRYQEEFAHIFINTL